MTDAVFSLRMSKHLRDLMRCNRGINWSEMIRESIAEKLSVNQDAKQGQVSAAFKEILKIRDSRVFDKGKPGAALIREWRDKRR